MSLAKGKLVVCLEVRLLSEIHRAFLLTSGKGGYNLGSISKSALAVTRTMIGEPPDRLDQTKPTISGGATVDMVRAYQRRFWTCLGSMPDGNSKG